MNSSVKLKNEIRFGAKNISFEEECFCVELMDGRKILNPLSLYPFLAKATTEQRNRFELSSDGDTIYFPKIDEYVSVMDIVLGIPYLDLVEKRKIIRVKANDDFTLECEMDNRETYRFDMSYVHEDEGEEVLSLREISFFKKVFIELGTLVWPNGLDIHGNYIILHGKLMKGV